MDYPRYVDRLAAAKAFAAHPRTITNILDRPYNKDTAQVPFLGLCKAAQCDPAWLIALLRGEDRAVNLSEAAIALGLSERQVVAATGTRKTVRPSAVLRRGLRFSAVALGIFNLPVSPLAGSPDSNVLTERGWECES